MNPDQPRPLRWRAAAAITAGLLGTGVALTAIAAAGGAPSPVQLAGVHEDQPGPCDEAEHANDPDCVGSTTSAVTDDSTSTTATPTTGATSPVPEGTSKTIDAAPGGTVVVAVQGGQLVVVSATPNGGWHLGEQRTVGREVEVRFLTSTARVDVNAELEDGQIRTRVRLRALDGNVSGTTTTIDDRGGDDDGANHDVGDDHGGDDDRRGHGGGDDDSSGSGSSGSGSSDHGGGSGSGRDHPEDD